MVNFNTKIELNEQVNFLSESKDKSIEEDFFNLLLNNSKNIIFNDDGGEVGLKNELKEFDISSDKKFGNEWNFKINKKSKSIIKKVFQANLTRGHRKWTLQGEDFSLTYIESGDRYDLMDGPSGSKTIYNHFIIKAKEKILDSINFILKYYITKRSGVSSKNIFRSH
ncbi:MAG: hypothetical protein U9Q99_00790 [Nanoarchaeota archaeon]|nr:hypothetical protein [Nanoarchaeota archaeon]